MVRELSLVKSTDQFTFIRTIKVKSGHNRSDTFTTNNLSSENLDDLVNPDSNSPETLSAKNISGEKLSDRQIKTSSALRPLNQQDVSSHLSLNNHPISISDHWYQPDFQSTNTSLFLPEIIIPPVDNNEPETKPKSHGYLDKILVAAAIGYCGFLGWSLFGAQNSILPTALFKAKQPTVSQADLDFLEYFEKSLAVIDNNTHQNNASSNTQTSKKDKQEDVVYLPVYTPTPPLRSTRNNFPLQPNSLLPPPPPPNNFAAFNPPVSSITIKKPAPPTRSSASASQKAPATSREQVSIASSSVPTLENNQPAKAQKIAPKPSIQPTLVGIIELKTKSAALFKVNGNTEKIWLGDKVGNTGWQLEAIHNQKAKISYQDKSMTLVIGQSFEATP